MNQFSNLRTTKKGACGEQIVKDYLISRGYNVAQFDGNSAHPVDFIAHNKGAKQEWFTFEVKTKPIKPPYTTTGFNESQYNDYIELLHGKYSFDTFVFFVDDVEGKCYGNYVSKLQKCITRTIQDPYTKKNILLWNRKDLIDVFTLTPQMISLIKQHN